MRGGEEDQAVYLLWMRAWCFSCEYNVTPVCLVRSYPAPAVALADETSLPVSHCAMCILGILGMNTGPSETRVKESWEIACLVLSRQLPRRRPLPPTSGAYTHTSYNQEASEMRRKKEARQAEKREWNEENRPSVAVILWLLSSSSLLLVLPRGSVAHTLYCAVPRQCFKLLSFIYSDCR